MVYHHGNKLVQKSCFTFNARFIKKSEIPKIRHNNGIHHGDNLPSAKNASWKMLKMLFNQMAKYASLLLFSSSFETVIMMAAI